MVQVNIKEVNYMILYHIDTTAATSCLLDDFAIIFFILINVYT